MCRLGSVSTPNVGPRALSSGSPPASGAMTIYMASRKTSSSLVYHRLQTWWERFSPRLDERARTSHSRHVVRNPRQHTALRDTEQEAHAKRRAKAVDKGKAHGKEAKAECLPCSRPSPASARTPLADALRTQMGIILPGPTALVIKLAGISKST